MKMDESHRAETGAFYTPKPWAGKAVECFRQMKRDLMAEADRLAVKSGKDGRHLPFRASSVRP